MEIKQVDDTTLNLYDPQLFRYEGADGTTMILHKEDGVRSVTDQNGNTLSFTAGGIIHSAGKSVIFERDSAGRIAALVDPMGQRQFYTYDDNGDLVAHEDATSSVTTMKYNRNHGLLEVADPLGNQGIR